MHTKIQKQVINSDLITVDPTSQRHIKVNLDSVEFNTPPR